MSRAEFNQGLKRKYERLKRKAVNCDNSSTDLTEKRKKSTGSIKKLRNQNGSRQEINKSNA